MIGQHNYIDSSDCSNNLRLSQYGICSNVIAIFILSLGLTTIGVEFDDCNVRTERK
jgi:hypothetical protein